MEYEILDEKTVVSYLRNRPELAAVFPDPENLIAREVGDGNLNLVFIIENEKNTLQSAILKQALPYLRVAGESWMCCLASNHAIEPAKSRKINNRNRSKTHSRNWGDCQIGGEVQKHIQHNLRRKHGIDGFPSET